MKPESRLVARWSRAAEELGLTIDPGFALSLEGGNTIHSVFRLRDFGARNGMLILDSYAPVEPVLDEVFRAGFGFSVLSEPREHEPFIADLYIGVLADWGWSGPPASRPEWLPGEVPSDEDDD